MFIDTHAHIYGEEFNDDLPQMIQRSINEGITDIFMPNIDSTSIDRMLEISRNYSNCHTMIGLHPCYVKPNYKDELRVMEKYLQGEDIVGIGEIGIDLYWDKTFHEEQVVVFRQQIEWARELRLPFVIHSRDSLDITIEIVGELQRGDLKGIFHCFNGNLDQAHKIMDLGFMMGIGGVITYRNAGVDQVAAQIPLEYLVLETDAPYLSPVPYRGKRNECSYIRQIAAKLAEVKNKNITEIGATTTINAKKIFSQPTI